MIRFAGTAAATGRMTIGPSDHGRLLALAEFSRAREVPGYTYEIIDGVLIVSPNPLPAHDKWVRIVTKELESYADEYPQHLNYVSGAAEAVIPGRPGPTRPQPDVAAYADFPDETPTDWADVCPVIVVEVISARREAKDTTRNRYLYWMAGGIAEYWIIDPRKDADKPTLTALVRKPGHNDWVENDIPFGKSHKSAALPRFTLNLKRPKRK